MRVRPPVEPRAPPSSYWENCGGHNRVHPLTPLDHHHHLLLVVALTVQSLLCAIRYSDQNDQAKLPRRELVSARLRPLHRRCKVRNTLQPRVDSASEESVHAFAWRRVMHLHRIFGLSIIQKEHVDRCIFTCSCYIGHGDVVSEGIAVLVIRSRPGLAPTLTNRFPAPMQ